MKLSGKRIIAALVAVSVFSAAGVGMALSTTTTAYSARATVTKEYCVDYRYYPYGLDDGFSTGHECLESKDFCQEYSAYLSEERTQDIIVDNGSCYKEITVVKTTPR